MTATASTTDNIAATGVTAEKAPFDAFGILYYPVYDARSDYDGIELGDDDMAWALTALANLDDTAYTLSLGSLHALAAYHHHVAEAQASDNPVIRNAAPKLVVNPLADVLRLVPDVTATPMYPDFPTQVMEMDEATYRYHQAMHYASTYGVELVAGLLGLNVTVTQGWLPDVEETEKTERDEPVAQKTVLNVVMDRETLLSVVSARFAKATRMHPAELETASLLIASGEVPPFAKIAFHENMIAMVTDASEGTSAQLADTLAAVCQHPGDLLKAIRAVIDHNGKGHLATRQKKAFCAAFESFGERLIAENIADAGSRVREITNYLSVARFGGEHLRRAISLVESGQVRSWGSRVEEAWSKTGETGFVPLLDFYDDRPGLLMRSLTRLVKAGCDINLLAERVISHADEYSLPTVVRNLAIMTSLDDRENASVPTLVPGRNPDVHTVETEHRAAYDAIAPILLRVLMTKLQGLDTPLRGKRVLLDTADISLVGSVIMPNDTGDTGTAWPPAGIAYDVPGDKTVRFFTFWDDRGSHVDVDLHFHAYMKTGNVAHIGWNGDKAISGMVMSGDITTSTNSVEYLDIDFAAARKAGVSHVYQQCVIFSGRPSWKDIETCYSGATVVSSTGARTVLYDRRNLLFRDDMTGTDRSMDYAFIDVANGYVRILRGTRFPFNRTRFTLEAYLRALFEAQGATVVSDPEDADIEVCVGRSEKEGVISLFDENFYVG